MEKKPTTYLESIIKYCQDIQDLKEHFGDYEEYLINIGYQYSMSFCLMQIGEMATKLRDAGVTEKYPSVEWKEIIGLRNKVAHGYDTIDIQMVYDICVDDIPPLLEECKNILQVELKSIDSKIADAKSKVRNSSTQNREKPGIEK